MKNRFVFPLLITLLVLLLLSPNAFSEETVVRVASYPKSRDADPSVVDIVIENGQNVAGYQVMVQFDSDFLEYQKMERGDYLPKNAFFGEEQIIDDIDPIDDSLKAIRFAATSFTGESNGYGILATLTFNRVKSGSSDLTLLTPGTLLSNKAGELSYPRLEHSKTYPKEFRDLVIGSIQARPSNSTKARSDYNKKETFTLHVTVRNKGNVDSRLSQLVYYGPTFKDTETGAELERVTIGEAIQPNHELELPLFNIDAPEVSGTYYYTVSLVGINEDVTDNNNSKPLEIRVEELPDLEVELIKSNPLSLDPSKPDGLFFNLSFTLKNEGNGRANSPIYYRWHRSTHPKIHSMSLSEQEAAGASEEIGKIEKIEQFRPFGPELPANESTHIPLSLYAPEEPGTYYYHVCVESSLPESNPDNNCSDDVEITVTPAEEDIVLPVYIEPVASQNVFSHIGLTLEDQFTDIAVTENATYFVWKPDVPKVRRDINNQYESVNIPYRSIITLDISPHDEDLADIDDLNELGNQGNLPSEYPYLIVRLHDKTPMNEWEEAGDIFTWRKVLNLATIGAIKRKIENVVDSLVDSLVDRVDSLINSLIKLLPGKWKIITKVVYVGSKVLWTVFVDARDLIAQEDAAKDLILAALHDPSVVTEDYKVFGIPPGDKMPRYLVMIPKPLDELKIKMTTNYFVPESKSDYSSVDLNISILKNQTLWDDGDLDLFWSPDEKHIRLHLPDGESEGKSLKTLFEYWIESDNNWYLWKGEYNSKNATQLSDSQKEYIKEKLRMLLNVWDQFSIAIHEKEINGFEWEKENSDTNRFAHPVLELPPLPSPLAIPASPWMGDYLLRLQLASAAAPHARTMSLADYPPFQELSPEVQALLMNHFGKIANTGGLNESERYPIPEETRLLPNYPNPFNPETWIPYQLSESADVTLTIYDINGHIVRDLDLGHQRAGMYHNRSRAAHWDGRNAQGESVASGIYFYTLTAGEFTATRKLLIRK
ncbi:MAG: T9SS type A sorting domain-containing protein [Candidatus Poribacteria bacterium]|nr:T9SS type A sorting domain-containing protein [Candidatus Poribacteria bacterium]